MAANIDAILREGIAAYKAGRKDEARSFLLRAVELDQYNEEAWLWLSAVVDTTEDQRTCLENVLAINPENDRARTGLSSLGNAEPAPPPVAKPSANAFATSVEWDTSPPGDDLFSVTSPPVTPEMSDDDYDDWVANLNLPTASSNAPSIPLNDSFSNSDPFGGMMFGADSNDEDLLSGDMPSVDLTGSPFSTLDFETVFGSPEAAAEMPPPPPPPPPSAKGETPRGLVMQSPGREANIFGDLDDIDLRSTGVFAQFERDDDDLNDTQLDDLDTEALFEYIPADIQATRLPGTRERYPVLLMVGLVVLVLLNVGALGLLVYRLM
jgi:hypothetical protein